MSIKKRSPQGYEQLIKQIQLLVTDSKKQIVRNVNAGIIKSYWQIGKYIVEYEQKGNVKAVYGKELLIKLAKRLSREIGTRFSRSNLIYMRLFYLRFQKSQTLSDQLGWSQYIELVKIEDDVERMFYLHQAITESWSVRELKRQKDSSLYQRLALSKKSKGVRKLSKGLVLRKDSDLVKDPYVFEFLGLSGKRRYSEKHFEKKIIDNLQAFLLEMGKGFTFVARQYRITIANTHHYVDLVFYHRILRCFVLIDLKINEVGYQDIGQMNMYLNYFESEQNVEEDKKPIGIILSGKKDNVLVEYATRGITNKIFVSKYQLYLPDRKLLQSKVNEVLDKDN
jgi:predicted nuclease of restriction endonuclease-like (RecB) superfamily